MVGRSCPFGSIVNPRDRRRGLAAPIESPPLKVALGRISPPPTRRAAYPTTALGG